MIGLLKLSNYIVIPDPNTLIIKEFKSILDADKSKKKEKAMKEFSFIYYMCDHNSPFSTYEDKEKEKEILNSLGIDWKIGGKVKAAMNKYLELSETSAVKLLKAAKESVIKLEKYFKDIDLTLVDDNGRPIFHAKDLVANLSKMGSVIEGLSKLEEQVKKEEQVNMHLRGGIEVNKYSK
tara:strand:+ start:187 stop:723 length:537 start_codon:yes stop_codon:yes gene_type:complete